MRKTHGFSLFLWILSWIPSLVGTIPSFADPSYTAIDLGMLQGGDNNSWGWGINDLGQIVTSGERSTDTPSNLARFLFE